MAHKDNGKLKFQNAHIRVLDDGTFLLEERFEKKMKPGKANEPVCMECENLEYSYDNADDLLKDLAEDLKGFAKQKNEGEDENPDDESNYDLKKIMKKPEGDEDE